MKFLITGTIADTGQMVPPELFTQIIEKGIILTLDAYNSLGLDKKIQIDRSFAGARTGVAIIDGNSDKEVNSKLNNTQAWYQVNWTITRLENF